MNEPKRVFRNAVGGFNKSDVNGYIAELCSKYEREKSELRLKIAELEAEKAKTTDAPSPELDRANAIISEQNEMIDKLKSERDALSEKLNSCESELTDARDSLSAFAESADKLESYNRMSAKLGALMLEAASNADRIKSDAEESARVTLASAEETRARLSAELESKYASAVAAVDKRLTEYAFDGMAALRAAIGDGGEELLAVLSRRSDAVSEAVKRSCERPLELDSLLGKTE